MPSSIPPLTSISVPALALVLLIASAPEVSGQTAPAAGRMTHIIFIIDGSSSILPGAQGDFELQKQGIVNSLCGPGRFVPHEGTVAVSVIQFSTSVTVEVPFTVLDTQPTADAVCASIDAIEQQGRESSLAPTLERVEDLFQAVGDASGRFAVLSTDGCVDDQVASLDQAEALRTMDLPATVCTVEVSNRCDPPGPEEAFLKSCANTPDAQDYEPSQPQGHYGCAQHYADLDDFAMLCRDCLCTTVNAGGTDCDDNGVPDRCETDCNSNGVLDACDIRDGFSEDCTGNGIPDECEPDCNDNDIADSCDIADATSGDCNDNGIPDECELGACCSDEIGLCTDDMTECECAGRWIEGAACDPDPFMPPCGTSACCEPSGHCSHLTFHECETLGGFWDEALACGDPCQNCGLRDVCYDGSGECTLPRPPGSYQVGCQDRCCCVEQCELDSYCCLNEWDQQCANNSLIVCDLPPLNDECWDPDSGFVAHLIDVPSSTLSGVLHATEDPDDPGFCCHGDRPASTGFGTVWFEFIAPPALPGDYLSSVQLDTCCSTAAAGAPADDSILQVFRSRDPDRGLCNDASKCSIDAQDCTDGSSCSSDASWTCRNLVAIGCNDDAGPACTCGHVTAPGNSKLCVTRLVPGEKYYVLLAAKKNENRGVYLLDATHYCSPPTIVCPSGEVHWIDPPNHVIDARQPHAVGDPGLLQGIAELTVEAPAGAEDPCCWTVCETRCNTPLHPPYEQAMQRNAVVAAVDHGDSAYSITLQRPITPGEITNITYTDGGGGETTGLFMSLPGNVDGDGSTAPSDIMRLIDYLNGVDTAPWGVYSQDIDHSGQRGPPDILRTIDLLNGAGAFHPWLNTPRPQCSDCCP